MSLRLHADGITVYPWPAQQRPTYQLEVDVLSFEPDTAGTAHLAARWFLREVTSRQTIAEREIHLTASGEGISTEQSVASLSKALGGFSLEIANAIREFIQPDTLQSAVGEERRSPAEP